MVEPDDEIPGADDELHEPPPQEPHIFLGDFGEAWQVWDVVDGNSRQLKFQAAKHDAVYYTDSACSWFGMAPGELRMHLQRAILETDPDEIDPPEKIA